MPSPFLEGMNQLMNDLITTDPYAPLYDEDAEVKAFRKSDVEAVEYLVRISQGKRETVETAKDWAIVSKLFEFWTRRWPQEWNEFAESIKEIKSTRLNKQGKSKLGEIKYVGALPFRFERLIRAIFPLQQFDKEFVYKLTKNIKITQVGERNDAWFMIPDAPLKRKTAEDIIKETIKDGNTD